MQGRKREMSMDDLLGRNDLHEYQKYSADFIVSHPAAALLLDCGLGKTVTTLTALDELLFDKFEHDYIQCSANTSSPIYGTY